MKNNNYNIKQIEERLTEDFKIFIDYNIETSRLLYTKERLDDFVKEMLWQVCEEKDNVYLKQEELEYLNSLVKGLLQRLCRDLYLLSLL